MLEWQLVSPFLVLIGRYNNCNCKFDNKIFPRPSLSENHETAQFCLGDYGIQKTQNATWITGAIPPLKHRSLGKTQVHWTSCEIQTFATEIGIVTSARISRRKD